VLHGHVMVLPVC